MTHEPYRDSWLDEVKFAECVPRRRLQAAVLRIPTARCGKLLAFLNRLGRENVISLLWPFNPSFPDDQFYELWYWNPTTTGGDEVIDNLSE